MGQKFLGIMFFTVCTFWGFLNFYHKLLQILSFCEKDKNWHTSFHFCFSINHFWHSIFYFAVDTWSNYSLICQVLVSLTICYIRLGRCWLLVLWLQLFFIFFWPYKMLGWKIKKTDVKNMWDFERGVTIVRESPAFHKWGYSLLLSYSRYSTPFFSPLVVQGGGQGKNYLGWPSYSATDSKAKANSVIIRIQNDAIVQHFKV